MTADLLNPADPLPAPGREVLATALDVAFSDARVLAHPLSVPFGDLVFQNLDMFAEGPDVGPEIADLDGLSVREVLAEADLVLGGDTATRSLWTTWESSWKLRICPSTPAWCPLSPWSISRSRRRRAVPEPSTWAMLLIGFAGLCFISYRASRSGKAIAPRSIENGSASWRRESLGPRRRKIMRLVRSLAALAVLAFAALPAHATTFTLGEFVS